MDRQYSTQVQLLRRGDIWPLGFEDSGHFYEVFLNIVLRPLDPPSVSLQKASTKRAKNIILRGAHFPYYKHKMIDYLCISNIPRCNHCFDETGKKMGCSQRNFKNVIFTLKFLIQYIFMHFERLAVLVY